MGVRAGGLGLRHLKDMALPAELAANLPARPNIAELSVALTTAGLTTYDLLLTHLDTTNRNLQADYEARLDLTEQKCTPNTYAANH